MSEATNTSIVQQAYEAFGRGDIPALLDTLDEQVDWHGVYGAAPEVITGGRRRGRAEVGTFFQQVAECYDFKVFEPREFIAQGDKVVALGHYVTTVKKTGRTVESDWAMVFTLRDGKVVKFVEFTNSAAINQAWT